MSSSPLERSADEPAAHAAAASHASELSGDARSSDTTRALDALRRVVRTLRLTAGRAEAETGLSAAQLFVLQQVAAAPGQSLTGLAARTLTDRTSVAAVVERLIARGLVDRRPSAEDRRRVEIHPTEAAAAILARAPHPPTRRILDGMSGLSDRELRTLAAALTRLADAMGLADEPASMFFEEGAGGDGAKPVRRRRAGSVDGRS